MHVTGAKEHHGAKTHYETVHKAVPVEHFEMLVEMDPATKKAAKETKHKDPIVQH